MRRGAWGGGGLPSLQLTTGLVVNSFVITSPTLAGERMLLIPKVSILSEQISVYYDLVTSAAVINCKHYPYAMYGN